ncbi:MAG: hypothetical protein J6A28_00690 [Clostridia bacterium]|nr:hypothetical protein [Clostridia bacterium]
MMIARKSSKIFVCLLFILLSFISLFSFQTNISNTGAYAATSNKPFDVSVLKDGNPLQKPAATSYQYSPMGTATAYVFNLKDVSSFKFNFDFSDEAIESAWGGEVPDVDNAGTSSDTRDDVYRLKIEVEFVKGYESSYFTDDDGNLNDMVAINNTLETHLPQSEGWQALETYSPIWNIHESYVVIGSDGQQDIITTWGIYRFKATVGGNISMYSDYYIIKPTMEVSAVPMVEINDDSIEEIIFQVSRAGEYQFIDPNQIVWYVYGTSEDGDRYVLLESDLKTDRFASLECTDYLHKNINRTGYTFTLPKPTVFGSWTVWCEYTPFGTTSTMKSVDSTFTTGQNAETFPYYWIIIIAAGLGLIGTIIATIIKVKHEKIY